MRLIKAIREGDIEAVKQHLAAGADVNAKDYGKTPLDYAEKVNEVDSPKLKAAKKEIADLLRKHGGKSGAEFSIHFAASAGNIEAVKQHLAAGVNVDATKDGEGWTPLHYAASAGHKEIVELLIAKRWLRKSADVNAKDGWSESTPLHHAARNGHKEIAERLIAKGADVNAKSDFEDTPLDVAIIYDQTELAAILRKHGGKRLKN